MNNNSITDVHTAAFALAYRLAQRDNSPITQELLDECLKNVSQLLRELYD